MGVFISGYTMHATIFLAVLAGVRGDDVYQAHCEFQGDGVGELSGEIIINEFPDGKETEIHGVIFNLTPGLHGFHVHEKGDLAEDCKAAGGHFNPMEATHGAPGNDETTRHVGDLGNIAANDEGRSDVRIEDHMVTLLGDNNVMGLAIVVHELMDDLGLVGDEGSLSTGNAGSRLGCCIITELPTTTTPSATTTAVP